MLLLLSQFNIIKLYISLVIVLTCIIECRKKNNYKLNVAEDVISTAIPNQDKKNLLRTSKTVNNFIIYFYYIKNINKYYFITI